MSRRSSAAVVGAGLSGILAVNSLKEEGFDKIICFEKTGYVGGLWRYHDDDIDGVASVMKTTIINTSKELGAFSTFPPPAEYPSFMHNSLMYEYLKSYSRHVGMEECTKFFHEVQKIEKAFDYEETGRWKITCKNTQTDEIFCDVFDCVIICIGHHIYPNIPTFPGQEQFKGKITHSHSLKNAKGFEDMRIVIVGAGNSAMDAAVELSYVAKQVYLSTRRGTWLTPKIGPYGLPFDAMYISRIYHLIRKIVPYNIFCNIVESSINKQFDHSLYNLRPKHRFFAQHPTLNNSLPIKLISGAVVVRNNIKTFTKNGVIFDGEENETIVDAVVLCTGYKAKFPFLSEEILPVKDNRMKLYKFIFPPDLPHPTLAIVGQIQPTGPGIPVSEIQGRWTCRVMSGKITLPSKKEMYADIKEKDDYNRWLYTDSPRHTFQVDFIGYTDELAEEIGCKPNFLKLAISDPKLFWRIIFGPSLPYQYRLQGPHAWEGARDAILTYEERVKVPLLRPDQRLKKKQRMFVATRFFIFSIMLMFFFCMAVAPSFFSFFVTHF